MIKTFCDCCGVEIKLPVINNTMKLPVKRVRIEPHSNVCGVTEEFLVELSVTAKIYKPKNLMDKVEESEFLGSNICPDCVVERIVQRE
jgi:hypothetical protein